MKKAAVLVAFAACSSPPAMPSGTHYTYVLDHVYVPRNATEAREYGLDLDGNGSIDNELGQVFAAAWGMGLDAATPTQAAVDAGSISLLADLQTPDLVTTKNAGFTLLFGDRQTDGSYTLAADTPTDTPLVGSADQASFVLGPGELQTRVAFMETSLVVTLPLQHARVVLDDVTADGVTIGAVAGAIERSALDTILLPNVAVAFEDVVKRDCGTTNGDKCGCRPNTLGAFVIDQFDTTPDCTITTPDIVHNDVVNELLAPDLIFDGKSYVSIGLGFTAVATRLD